MFRRTGSTSSSSVVHPHRALLQQEAIVFPLQTAEELEEEHEGDDADARAREHAFGGNVPCRGEEARVDGVPVPEHL